MAKVAISGAPRFLRQPGSPTERAVRDLAWRAQLVCRERVGFKAPPSAECLGFLSALAAAADRRLERHEDASTNGGVGNGSRASPRQPEWSRECGSLGAGIRPAERSGCRRTMPLVKSWCSAPSWMARMMTCCGARCAHQRVPAANVWLERSGASERTSRTGSALPRTTASATLPKNQRPRPPWPCVAITSRSPGCARQLVDGPVEDRQAVANVPDLPGQS